MAIINGIEVDTSALEGATGQFIMRYNQTTNKLEFIPFRDAIGLADGDGDEDTLDFGPY